jgi:drug/metabolite transporter (DMT)-like permease
MNAFKSTVAALLFLTAGLLLGPKWLVPLPLAAFALMLSGLIGLNIGDLFLLRSYAAIGSGRTLMIFSFHPLFLGVASYFLFGQPLTPKLLLAIVALSGCVVILGHESYRATRRWNLSGLMGGVIAAVLDASGILLTRWALDLQPELDLFEINFLRCAGALCGFAILSRYSSLRLFAQFRSMPLAHRGLAVGAAALGTFFALTLWLHALKLGNVAAVAAVSGTGPLFATFVECAIERRRPSAHLLAALSSFAVGFWLLLH